MDWRIETEPDNEKPAIVEWRTGRTWAWRAGVGSFGAGRGGQRGRRGRERAVKQGKSGGEWRGNGWSRAGKGGRGERVGWAGIGFWAGEGKSGGGVEGRFGAGRVRERGERFWEGWTGGGKSLAFYRDG